MLELLSVNSSSAFLPRVSSVLHNFSLLHMADVNVSLNVSLTQFFCACRYLRLYCFFFVVFVPCLPFCLVISYYWLLNEKRHEWDTREQRYIFICRSHIAWIHFASWMCLICKIQAHHYVKQEFQGISVTWKENIVCFAVTMLSGELVETVGSLCDFEKFYKTSSSHALY